MTGYFKLDSTRVSYGEYWRWKPGPAFLIMALSKLLRVRFPATVLVPALASIEVVDPQLQPPMLVTALDKPIRACQERGYQMSFWYTVGTIGAIMSLGAALVRADGVSVAMAIAGQTKNGTNREVRLGLVSRLLNGRLLLTANGRSLFDPAPEVDEVTLPTRTYPEVLDAHDIRVSRRKAEVGLVGDVRELIRQVEQAEIRWNATRGIYVPASAEDVAKAFQQPNR